MRTAPTHPNTHGTACHCNLAGAASNPARRISSHRTSHGRVVYFRCDCGTVHMNIVNWS